MPESSKLHFRLDFTCDDLCVNPESDSFTASNVELKSVRGFEQVKKCKGAIPFVGERFESVEFTYPELTEEEEQWAEFGCELEYLLVTSATLIRKSGKVTVIKFNPQSETELEKYRVEKRKEYESENEIEYEESDEE